MNKIKYLSLIAVVVVIAILHYLTPGQMIFFHNTYSKLSYFPIVLGAVWFGMRGGFSLAALTSMGFVPHLLIFRGFGIESYLSELIEVLLYFAIGGIVGYISGKESKLKSSYKQLSEKLEESYEHLHEETRLLLEVEEQLRQKHKLSALGEVAATVAHEIKNPLASIKGVSEILSDEFRGDHPKKEFMEIMNSEIKRLDLTVTDMLSGVKSPSKNGTEDLKGISEIMESILLLLDEKIRNKQVQIIKELSPESALFQFENRKVYQIFFNLILNALDAVKESGIIRLKAKTDGTRLNVYVEDDGPGIPEDQPDLIFKPFYSNKEDGTGLGLSIVKKFVESLNGQIEVQNTDLGGAGFCVTLPM